MPQIDIAMMASRAQPLFPRASSISGEVSSVKNTFSSWDNCMAESYCKWPVIAAIIVVGLIIFSVLWCIVRCACCGLSCCCTCFSCLKCCGECCGMCDGGRKEKNHKNLDDPYRPQPQPFEPAPFRPSPAPYAGYQAPKPMAYQAPQYAQFETGRSGLAVDPKPSPVHEDALPPMPSWEGAASRRIPTVDQKEEGMEMGNLTPDGQHIPLMSGGVGRVRSPGPTSPAGEANAGFFGGRGAPGQNGYMQGQPGGNMPAGPGGISRTGSPAMMNGRGGMGGPGVGGPGMAGPGMGYGGPNRDMATGGGPQRSQFNQSPGPGMSGPGMGFGGPDRGNMVVAGVAGGSMGGPPRGQFNSSPGPQGFNNQRPGFPPTSGYRGPPQRQYSNNASGPYERNPPPRQYSNDSGAPLPLNGPPRQYSNDSGVPYPRGGPQRQFSGNTGYPRAGPERQYSADSYRPSQDMHRPPVSPSSPLNNTGGFDFTGNSTPSRFDPAPQHAFAQDSAQTEYAASTTTAPSYATRDPYQQQPDRHFSPPPNEFHFNDNDHGQQRSFSPVEEAHEILEHEEPIATKPDGGVAYPGYKPYSPAPVEAARSTPPPPPSSLMPGRPNY